MSMIKLYTDRDVFKRFILMLLCLLAGVLSGFGVVARMNEQSREAGLLILLAAILVGFIVIRRHLLSFHTLTGAFLVSEDEQVLAYVDDGRSVRPDKLLAQGIEIVEYRIQRIETYRCFERTFDCITVSVCISVLVVLDPQRRQQYFDAFLRDGYMVDPKQLVERVVDAFVKEVDVEIPELFHAGKGQLPYVEGALEGGLRDLLRNELVFTGLRADPTACAVTFAEQQPEQNCGGR